MFSLAEQLLGFRFGNDGGGIFDNPEGDCVDHRARGRGICIMIWGACGYAWGGLCLKIEVSATIFMFALGEEVKLNANFTI